MQFYLRKKNRSHVSSNLRRALLAVILMAGIGGSQAATITVDSALDNNNAGDGLCTLREAALGAALNIAIDSCTSGSSGFDRIEFAAAVFPGPLKLAVISLTDQIDVTESLEIVVPNDSSLSLIGTGSDPVFVLNQGVGDTFSLNNTLIRGGTNTDPGGAISYCGWNGAIYADACHADGELLV